MFPDRDAYSGRDGSKHSGEGKKIQMQVQQEMMRTALKEKKTKKYLVKQVQQEMVRTTVEKKR